MRRQIETLAPQMTGVPWRGSLTVGPDRDCGYPWGSGGRCIGLTIWIRSDDFLCGAAAANQPARYISLNTRCGLVEWLLRKIFPHELGHAFGFFHVSDPYALMCSMRIHPCRQCASGTPRLTADEQYHMQLAYEVGADRRYCGWPYSAACGR